MVKLTFDAIRQLVTEELSNLLRENKDPMRGGYVQKDKKGNFAFLPLGFSKRGQPMLRKGLQPSDYQMQEKIAELASDGTIHIVEDIPKGKIEFFYLEDSPFEGDEPIMTFYGSLGLSTPLKDVYKAALQVKKEVSI